MKQLKEKVKKEFNEMINEIADMVVHAKKTGELNSEEVWKETSNHVTNISLFFDEAEQRYRQNPKKFMQ